MSNLATILAPTANLPVPDNHENTGLPSQGHGGGDFDDFMSQVLSPSPHSPQPAATLAHGSHTKPPLLNPNDSSAKPPVAQDNPAPVTPKTSSKTGDSATATHKTTSKNKETSAKETKTEDPAVALDLENPQNLPIQFLAPTLSSLLLQPGSLPVLTQAGQSASTPVTAIGENPKHQQVAPEKTVAETSVQTGKNHSAPSPNPSLVSAAEKVADAIKNLGLPPATPPKTAGNTASVTPNSSGIANASVTPNHSGIPLTEALKPEKIAGENFTAAKIDPTPQNAEKAENMGKSTKNEVPSTPIAAGTPVAQEDSSMKKADNTNKVAGQTEKVLPVTSLSSARMSNSLRASSASAPSHDLPTATNIIPISSALDGGPTASNSPEPVAVTNLSDIQTRSLERTHDMVTMHALRLVNTQSDSLQVVLKPGAGTQLSLELRQRGDVVEAQAVLQHGDYQNLSQHWPDLQQRLEQKGIKLGSLGSDESAMTFNGHQGRSQDQQSSPEQEALFASAFAEFSLAGHVTGVSAPAAAAGGRGSWESWA